MHLVHFFIEDTQLSSKTSAVAWFLLEQSNLPMYLLKPTDHGSSERLESFVGLSFLSKMYIPTHVQHICDRDAAPTIVILF